MQSRQRTLALTFLGAVLLCCGINPPANAQGVDLAWAQYFGDGMRMWAEGRYEEALTLLYRAHAISPTERTYAYIIRSHDFTGNCTAAEAQLEQMNTDYPGATAPPLQLCYNPATLSIQCEHPTNQILIDDKIHVSCDREVRLPGGVHDVYVPSVDFRKQVLLEDGKREVVKVKTTPKKWSPASDSGHTRVPHVASDRDRITVFMAEDGVYRVWVQENGPEMLPVHGGAICKGDARGNRTCTPMTPEQHSKIKRIIPRLD